MALVVVELRDAERTLVQQRATLRHDEHCARHESSHRRRDERGLEALADLVALPDVGLEEDLPLRARDRWARLVREQESA